jgi:hypothetical protein
LRDVEEESTRRWEMVGRRGNEGGQGAKRVKAIGDVDETFLEVFAGICAGITTSGQQPLRALLSSDVFNLYSWYSACPL